MNLQQDLRAFVEFLNAARVKYLIVGGYAVAYHGHMRFTDDIDFLVEPSRENANRVVQAISAFGFGGLGLKADDFVHEDAVIQLGYPPNRIDLLTSIEAVPFDEAWANRIEDQIDGLPSCFLSRELLIRNKRAVGRPEDLADISKLP